MQAQTYIQRHTHVLTPANLYIHAHTHRARTTLKWSAKQKCWPMILFVRTDLTKSLTGYELEPEWERESITPDKKSCYIFSSLKLSSTPFLMWLKWLQNQPERANFSFTSPSSLTETCQLGLKLVNNCIQLYRESVLIQREWGLLANERGS